MQFNIFKDIITFFSSGTKVDEDSNLIAIPTNRPYKTLCGIRYPPLWISLPVQLTAHFELPTYFKSLLSLY